MKLYGILTGTDGSSLIRATRNVKVSIGLLGGPSGATKDIHVFIAPTGEWKVQAGMKTATLKTRAEAEAAYGRALAVAPARKAPRKLPYFTFTRQAADGTQEPDFGAIEAHGAMPTRVPIALFGSTEEDVCTARFQFWTKTSLQCEGDGRDFRRLATLAKTPEEKALIRAGERYFTVRDGCWCFAECPFWGKECHPHVELRFQLVKYPLVGGSAGYASTSFKTTRTLGGQVTEIFGANPGGVHGLVVTMEMLPYQVRQGKAYYVRLHGEGIAVKDIDPPAGDDRPEEQRARDFTDEFAPVSEPEPEAAPAPAPEVPGPALTDEQRAEIQRLAAAKKLNKARVDTWLAGLPKSLAYSEVLKALAEIKK